MENFKGPRLDDAEFFIHLLNTDIPAMSKSRDSALKGNFSIARKQFADNIRSSLKKDQWFSIPYVKPPNFYMYAGEELLAAADRICTHEIISCGMAYQLGEKILWEKNPTPTGFHEWVYHFNRHNEWNILAEAYRQTQNTKYVKEFIKMLKGWLEQEQAPDISVPWNGTKAWRTLECAIRMATNWPHALHCFIESPLFTDDIIVDFYKSVWEHGCRLTNGKRDGNWLLHEMTALYIMGVLYPQLKDAASWYEYGFSTLQEELQKQFYPDGFHCELTTNYHEATAHVYISILRFARAYAIELPSYFNDKIENMLSLYEKIMMPDGRLPDLNDGTWEKASAFMRGRLDLFPERSDFLWVASEGRKGSPPDFTSILLPYSGFSVMRTGWDADSIWAIFDAGPFGTGVGQSGHQHEDKLNLLIYANGKLTVTEGGCYPYDDSEMRRYIRTSRSHNTVRINHLDQNRRSEYTWNDSDINKPADMRYSCTDTYECTIGTYTEGYGPEMKRLAKHQRKVIFLKMLPKDIPPFFIVIDRLHSENQNLYEFLWHLDGNDLQKNGLTVNIDGMHITVPDDCNTEALIIKGQKEPEWQGWKPGAVLGDFSPAPVLSYRIKAKELRLVTVFIPFKSKKTQQIGLKASADPKDTELFLTFPNGKVLPLDEADYPADPINIP